MARSLQSANVVAQLKKFADELRNSSQLGLTSGSGTMTVVDLLQRSIDDSGSAKSGGTSGSSSDPKPAASAISASVLRAYATYAEH